MPFPDKITNYGLTYELLSDAVEQGARSKWSLHGVPNVEFYRKLHLFLKRWSRTRSLTKTCIGKFYLAIDQHLRERGSTPYNTYRFIEQLVSSDVPDRAVMSYGSDKKLSSLKAEIQSCHEQCQILNEKMKEQEAEMEDLKMEVEKTKEDLLHTKNALQGLMRESSGSDRCIFQKGTK